MVLKPEFFRVNTKRIDFEPFPGRYPTRWVINIKDKKDEVKFVYFGKPNQDVAKKVQHIVEHQRGSISAVEFDKLGAFRVANRPIPRDETTLTFYSLPVIQRYYPWMHYTRDFFYDWRMLPQYPKLFKLGKKAFFVYSPHPALLEDERKIELCRNFRKWLQLHLANVAKSKL
jgi:hypothetical protein